MKVEKILKEGDVLLRFGSEEIDELATMLANIAAQYQELEPLANQFEQLNSLV